LDRKPMRSQLSLSKRKPLNCCNSAFYVQRTVVGIGKSKSAYVQPVEPDDTLIPFSTVQDQRESQGTGRDCMSWPHITPARRAEERAEMNAIDRKLDD
jgi:hypothetical protein